MSREEFLKLRNRLIKADFKKMNEAQAEAVFCTKGPLLVLAGAGSGKTTVIINRIAHLIKYGEALTFDRLAYEPSSEEVEILRSYLKGERETLPLDPGLISVNPAKPWEILAITFTNKAAQELKDRLAAMLGEDASKVWASTFHSACARILRKHADLLGYTSNYTIYDMDDSRKIIKECQKALKIGDKRLPHKTILSVIGRAKDNLIDCKLFKENAGTDIRMQEIALAYEKYQSYLKTADAMDFDDIIFNTVKLLEGYPDILDYYNNRFKYILVDEYQDTNFAQYRLVSLLAQKHENICVVGDDDQSIYKFRGATIENILNFEKHFKQAKTIRLEKNYRSTQTILDAANSVISNNKNRKGKNLWTDKGQGEKIKFYTAYDAVDEANHVAQWILKSVADGKRFSEHAVLYRLNAQSNTIESSFARNGIPYRVIGGLRFYERKEVRDALAYLTLINNPSDNTRLRRIINEPKRGIGNTTLSRIQELSDETGLSLFEIIENSDEYAILGRAHLKLKQFANLINDLRLQAENLSLAEILQAILDKTSYISSLAADPLSYSDRVENLNELSATLYTFEADNEGAQLNDFLEEVALITDIDNYNANTDAVTLMTVHSAKGLEFPSVFLIGMEEGIFPGARSTFKVEDVEEERRLAYVAITRAKEELYISNAHSRLLYGSTSHNPKSRFVEEIPDELIENLTKPQTRINRIEFLDRRGTPSVARSKSAFSKSQKDSQVVKISYKVGDCVEHKTFGRGILISMEKAGNDYLLEVAFDKVGTKKLMANFANLQKVPS
ncbi:MAG: UvrD-helicase domain-containing protein [Clostridiales bacterium]|nr:UvrD-helicase domain-containing protein [Clostridiales bacterium]